MPSKTIGEAYFFDPDKPTHQKRAPGPYRCRLRLQRRGFATPVDAVLVVTASKVSFFCQPCTITRFAARRTIPPARAQAATRCDRFRTHPPGNELALKFVQLQTVFEHRLDSGAEPIDRPRSKQSIMTRHEFAVDPTRPMWTCHERSK